MKRQSNVVHLHGKSVELPTADNTPEAVKIFRAANERFRQVPWPEPYHRTSHTVRLGDARKMADIKSDSVHLVVTSPPYWTLKKYVGARGQLGDMEDYETFLH
jgi:site-specific DNA-methyltransferase (adenine-specific)